MADYRQWPERFEAGVVLARQQTVGLSLRNVQSIYFLGMGGSAVAGTFVASLCRHSGIAGVFDLDPCDLPTELCAATDEGFAPLVIATSCSGNTWEVTEAIKALCRHGIKPLVVTRGGVAGALASELGLAIIAAPQRPLQPREEMGLFVGILLGILEAVGVSGMTELIGRLGRYLKTATTHFSEHQRYADFLELAAHRPAFQIWGISGDSVAAVRRFQTQCNENAKIPVVSAIFPELAHNIVVGFTEPEGSPLIVICGTDYVGIRLQNALSAVRSELTSRGVQLYTPPLFGDTWEEQLLGLVLWGDFASCYLAEQRGVPIDPVDIIARIKDGNRLMGSCKGLEDEKRNTSRVV